MNNIEKQKLCEIKQIEAEISYKSQCIKSQLKYFIELRKRGVLKHLIPITDFKS